MRLLPDRHIRVNYKKRYAANYERLCDRRQKRADKKAAETLDTVKQKLVGSIVFVIIILIVFLIGSYLFGVYSEKESQIQALENEIRSLDETIKEYQIVDSEDKFEQLNEAVRWVSDLQNQYITGEFSDTFDVYAARYLGQYNENWADDIDNLENPVWQGYLDRSCDFKESAVMLFILYDKGAPVLVVNVRYSMDRFGNLGEMIHMDKAELI